MSEKIRPYHVIDLPPGRRGIPSFNDLQWRKHSMYGLPFNPTINPVIFDVAVLVALLLARWPSASLIGS